MRRNLRCSVLVLLAAASSSAAAGQTQTQRPPIDPGLAVKSVTETRLEPHASVSTVVEPPTPTSRVDVVRDIVANRIMVDGGDDLPAADMAAATSSYTGHRLSAGDVQDLLTAVSGVARAHGYLFAHSSIKPQTMTDGVLRIELDEGRIDQIRLTGDARASVAKVLAPLSGHAPKAREVEARLLLAGDLPGISIGKVSYAIERGLGVLIVPVTYARIDGSATFDNRGLQSLGPERARINVNVNDLLREDDQVTFQGLATPLQPKELIALYGRYAIQPTAAGTEFAIYGSYGETHSGGEWRSYQPQGTSDSYGFSIGQPLFRSRATSLWLTIQADRIAVDEWWDGALVRRDRVTTLGVSISGFRPLAGGRLKAGAGVTQGILALGATARDNPLASRYDAGSDFTTINAWANWQAGLFGPIDAKLATTSQISTAPLPAVEQVTIGGQYFGRGYNWSERTGDEGVLGSAELRALVMSDGKGVLRWTQLYTFGDAGYVRNMRTDFGTGELYSAGAGARLGLAQALNLEFEAAFPISADRYDSKDRSPRLSFSLSGAF